MLGKTPADSVPAARHIAAGALAPGLSVVVAGATWRTWRQMLDIGLTDQEQSHILIAPAAAIWLAWVWRVRLRTWTPRYSLWGPVCIGAGCVVGTWGAVSGTAIGQHTGAVLILLGAALTFAGPHLFLRLAPAVGALVFLIPVPGRLRQQVALPLQELSAWASHGALDLLGVPVTRAGNTLVVNGQSVAIAEACNGMRMVAALALVTYVFAFSTPMRGGMRLALLAASPALALAVNIGRLVPTALLFGYADRQTAELFHDASGWGALALALLLLCGLRSLVTWIRGGSCQAPPPAPALSEARPRHPWAALAPAASIAMVAALWCAGGTSLPPPMWLPSYHASIRDAAADIPRVVGAWVGTDVAPTKAAIELLDPNVILQRRYVDAASGARADLLLVHCASVRDMTGHFPPVCYPAHGWVQGASSEATVELAGRAGPARRYEFTRFEGTTLRRLYVLDFFLLAGDRAIVGDMRTMERATRDPRVGALGVGQVQIIQESEDATARQRAEREILLAIGPLSAVIARETNQWTTPSPLSMTR